ncbi:MAG TPA: hypothetical protein VFI78_00515 [Salinimicrobium sp.]|nr:hypothetical protein [Salinimicrobium sp.]
MDLSARKYEIIQKLLTVNEKVVEKLEDILDKETGTNKRISIDEYNKEIYAANERIENGEFYTQEEVEKMADKW